MPHPVLKLHPGRERALLAGHPWVFAGAVANLDTVSEPGAVVDLHSHEGEFIARAYANPRCGIAARVLTRRKESIDAAFFQRRLSAALQLRRAALDHHTNAFRLLNGEGDELPGFIVDVY